jgi:hypothetical protein
VRVPIAFPPEVLRHRAWALFGSGALCLVGAGTIVGTTVASASMDFLLMGAAALAMGTWMARLTISWYQRALQVIGGGASLVAQGTLVRESGLDSVTLYVEVRGESNSDGDSCRIPVVIPRWDYMPLTATWWQADLYVDQRTGRCVAIGSQGHMIWSLPHNHELPASLREA